jgi:hypothetical protein
MKILLSFFAILTLATIACGVNIDLPQVPTPGPEITDQITVAVPNSEGTHLKISFGAGKLTLSPGAEGNLVDGTATYNIPNFKPEVIEGDGTVEIKQGDFKSINVTNLRNEWDLKLAETPMELEINAGAYEGNYEFGGLALRNLTIKDGASSVKAAFSEPNQTKMTVFRYETGASNVELTGLANANFSTLIFNGGAGSYTLDFSGELAGDATARVETDFGDLMLVIPKDVNARVTIEGAAVNVNHSSGWGQSDHTYIQAGSGPTLTLIVKMAAGNVTLTD